MWKEPVFNFWETHKSLSLLSYLPQNWKQMLPFFIRLWTGQLWSCENKNPPVNLSCSLSSFFTLFFSSFFILTPLSLFSLLRFLVFVFFLSSLLTRLCRRCACVYVGGDQWCQSQNREHWENWRNAIQLQSDMTLEKGGCGAESCGVFPGHTTARGLGFDLFKAFCLLLDEESWLRFVSAGERERKGEGERGMVWGIKGVVVHRNGWGWGGGEWRGGT